MIDRRNGYTPDTTPQVQSKTLKYKETQEHLLRRLGAAIVLQWDTLPDDLQDRVIDQAAIVEDRDEAPHEANDIANFIRSVKVMSISKAPAAAEQSE